MKVAWHEIPGNVDNKDPSRRARCDLRYRALSTRQENRRLSPTDSYRSLRDGSRLRGIFQALRARLPSFSPYGTKHGPTYGT
jgi:hypothetical protein